MLVLSRKTRQQILIGDNITVTILLVKGQVVRVGIEAPRDVRVLRAELPVFEDEPTAVAPAPRPVKAKRSSTAKVQPSTAATTSARAEEGASRTSPGLLELRRRGSLSSLTRPSGRPGGMALRPLFERH
ncbi:MAG TPA: carbon storage regulator [Pirellulales bacterium]|jgi:carbon storage regulator CsrA